MLGVLGDGFGFPLFLPALHRNLGVLWYDDPVNMRLAGLRAKLDYRLAVISGRFSTTRALQYNVQLRYGCIGSIAL